MDSIRQNKKKLDESLNVDYTELTEKEILQMLHQETLSQHFTQRNTLLALESIKNNMRFVAWILILSIIGMILSFFMAAAAL